MVRRRKFSDEYKREAVGLRMSARSANRWVDEAEVLIKRLLKERCLGEFLNMAAFPRPKTGHPEMNKEFAEKHVHALKALTDNLTIDDLKDASQ